MQWFKWRIPRSTLASGYNEKKGKSGREERIQMKNKRRQGSRGFNHISALSDDSTKYLNHRVNYTEIMRPKLYCWREVDTRGVISAETLSKTQL